MNETDLLQLDRRTLLKVAGASVLPAQALALDPSAAADPELLDPWMRDPRQSYYQLIRGSESRIVREKDEAT